MIVGDGAERPADGRFLEKDGKPGHQHGAGPGGEQVELVQEDAGDLERLIRDADVQYLDVRAPGDLTDALEKEIEADGGHEQDDALLVDQVAQHHPFDQHRQQHHDHGRNDERQQHRHPTLHQADQGQRREQHHSPLGEVEDARSLENEDESERHQRVHDAGQHPADHHLGEKNGAVGHVEERRHEKDVKNIHGLSGPPKISHG